MDTLESALSPQDSLNLITEVIHKTKENVKEQYFCFLLWGWLIASASILFFALQEFSFKYYFLPFPILSAIGILFTVLYFKKRLSTSETYLNHFLNRMWIVLGVSFIAVVFINIFLHHAPFTYTLLLAAIGTAITGLIIRFRPLVIGGGVLLVSALISVFISSEFTVLLHGLAIICGYLVPGYLLKYSKADL